MSAASPQLRTRPSAKASSVPATVLTTAGMRKHAYPGSWTALNSTCCSNPVPASPDRARTGRVWAGWASAEWAGTSGTSRPAAATVAVTSPDLSRVRRDDGTWRPAFLVVTSGHPYPWFRNHPDIPCPVRDP